MGAISFQDLAARLGPVGGTAVRSRDAGVVATGSPPTLTPKPSARCAPGARPASLIRGSTTTCRSPGGDQGVCVRLDDRGGHKLLDHDRRTVELSGVAWRGAAGRGGRPRPAAEASGADRRGARRRVQQGAARCAEGAEGVRRGRCAAHGRRSAQEWPGAGTTRLGKSAVRRGAGRARRGRAKAGAGRERRSGGLGMRRAAGAAAGQAGLAEGERGDHHGSAATGADQLRAVGAVPVAARRRLEQHDALAGVTVQLAVRHGWLLSLRAPAEAGGAGRRTEDRKLIDRKLIDRKRRITPV